MVILKKEIKNKYLNSLYMDNSFDNLMNQMKDLNIKFNKYLNELQIQLDILSTEMQICRCQMIENEQDFKELKHIMKKIIIKYRLYDVIK
jgi:hypothetical protein